VTPGDGGAALLAAVERSPQAAAARDRAGWVGLFTTDGRIEDPVGSRPHVGHAQIGRFYDTFIGPRDITFHPDLDIVSGPVVLRDLELEVAMGPAVTMHIPALLRYDLEEDPREANGQWQIAQLRAYWELPAMMRQFLGSGPQALSPALRLSRGLLGNQGLRGTAGFATGFRRVGTRQKKLVQVFLSALARDDVPGVLGALSPTAAITLGDDDALGLAELGAQLDGAAVTKMNGAGTTVAVSLASGHGRAILFADVAWRRNAITRIRYFPA
jgi:Nuclear transport factor 2 (NTF2) domain